jgi:hypothetical protein
VKEGMIAILQSGGDKRWKNKWACDGKNEWDNAF